VEKESEMSEEDDREAQIADSTNLFVVVAYIAFICDPSLNKKKIHQLFEAFTRKEVAPRFNHKKMDDWPNNYRFRLMTNLKEMLGKITNLTEYLEDPINLIHPFRTTFNTGLSAATVKKIIEPNQKAFENASKMYYQSLRQRKASFWCYCQCQD